MPELLLVRHGETDWSGRRYCGRTDLPLNAAGRVAARALAARLAGELAHASASGVVPRIRLVSSPLLRARQTAEALLEVFTETHLRIDARWSEVDFGSAEGLTYEELRLAQPELADRVAASAFAIDWPGGETAIAFAARVTAAFDDVARSHGPTLVVSHGGPLRLAIALATGRDPGVVTAPQPGQAWRGPGGTNGGAANAR